MWKQIVDAIFKERHSTIITVTLPTKLFMALETYVYIRNETRAEGESELDRDFVIGTVLARFLTKQLTKEPPKEVTVIPPSLPDDSYTQGRKQSRSLSPYSEYPPN